MEASFGDVHMTSGRKVHIKWESQPLECTPSKGTVQFTWKDQGWGNRKGELFLMLMSASGQEKDSYCLTNQVSPHEWEDVKVEVVATDSILAEATTGCWYQVRAEASASGGHELYVKNFVLSLTEASKEIERSSGDVSIIDTNAQLKWKSEDLTMTPISGSIQCRWKDQGWGNQKAMLFLNLMAPDGSEKASFKVKDSLAPHEWEDVNVDLVATDAVLAEATVGCWYQVKVECGQGGGHEMNVVGLVLQLAEPVTNPTMEASFGDVHMTSGRKVHLKWESQPLRCTPSKGTVQFTWKDQGWGNRKGELFLMLMSASGQEKNSYCLTNQVSPHEWEDVKVELVATDPVLAEATTGCWYQVRAEASASGGHELYVKNIVFSLTEASAEIKRSFGDVSIIDTNAQLKWKSEGLTMKPMSGSIQCRWKDQGWGNQKAMLFLNLMAPDGSKKAYFTLKDGYAPHEWEDLNVDLVAADAVVAEATVGCWYQVKVECGQGGGHEMNVVGLVLKLAGEVLQPQGTHYPANSSAPLLEAVEWSGTPGAYFNKLKAANSGAPIYKAHPGLACIAITDHAGGKWFFEQPDTVLDRQNGAFFGPLMCSEAYVGDSLPALVTNIKESHAAVRAYTIAILMERLSVTQTALTHASDKFYANLRTNGLGEYTTVYDTFLQQSYAFMLEWVFGTGEEGGQDLPPFKDFVNVNNSDLSVLMTLKIDTLPTWSAAGPTQSQLDSVEVLLDSIRASKMWPMFTEMLEENNVPILSPERSFMFNTGFQSSSALAKNMEYAVGVLSAMPDFAAELRTELDGQNLTMASVANVDKFPLLDSLHWEILRMFPAPPFFFKTAKMDLLVPTSTGQQYQMRKGDMLYCHQPLVQIDETKFGTDAREFNPKRFVGNPDLKKDVFAYGFPDPANVQTVDGMPWGCIAHSIGVLDGIIKVFYGRWVQEATWEMTEPAVIDPDLFLGTVGPEGMSFAKVTPR